VTEWSAVARYLSTDALAHLATLGKDGGPRSVPVWVDLHDGLPDAASTGGQGLAFFTEEGSVKDRNLARDPRLALSVTAPGNPLSMATVRGEVVDRLTGGAAMEAVDRISRAYTGGPYDVRSGFVAFLVRPTSWWANDYAEG
jgi:PPOX class probable F420-dependent enzyme